MKKRQKKSTQKVPSFCLESRVISKTRMYGSENVFVCLEIGETTLTISLPADAAEEVELGSNWLVSIELLGKSEE